MSRSVADRVDIHQSIKDITAEHDRTHHFSDLAVADAVGFTGRECLNISMLV